MLTPTRLIQLLIMLSLLIGLFVWRTLSFESSEQSSSEQSNQVSKTDQLVCQLSKPCVLESASGRFILTVEEGEVVPDQPFNISLTSELKNWTVSDAKMVSEKGFEGKISVTLVPVESINHSITYQAQTMVGACSEKNASITLQITLLIDDKTVPIEYTFLVAN
ncbi:hypothetical protein DS885_02740 [Psychromonas sp. B3M02]|uniref:hypothetical protein n=1 Tax=Psychromonas sp. B3M02 TaxID=2267226 RepID=UPI000DE9449B|nr:hypothetical protein [Psychromonas sp. B3M02]RBW47533.1 hypothetical protein DS885_02740 [Psychromonas sp. B3M02]